jgi:rRNA small subunit pseudouridine methyltransferase Nep1
LTTQYFFILADSELELVPKEIQNERCVMNNARARGKAPDKILLDASHHHPAFGRLRDSERRGRPDITHFFLMLCLDSDLSAAGRLRAFVHTRNDDVIAVNSETRLPPNYPRFIGLIETLYEKQVVPSAENALLELRQGVPLETLVSALKPDSIMVVDNGNEKLPEIVDGLSDSKSERVVVIIGGFSKGGYRSDLSRMKPKPVRYSMGARQMKVWTITSKTLCSIEIAERGSDVAEPKKKAKAPSKPRRAPKKKAE